MKNILPFFLLIFSFSFICNFYLEEKIRLAFLEIQMKNIKRLEHHSNKNFYGYGIENIGESLQKELMKMKTDECLFNVRRDYFYFFQDKAVYITNRKKCLKVTVSYNLLESLFRIKGFQSCNF